MAQLYAAQHLSRLDQNDEWLVGRRYLSAHSLEAVLEHEKEDKDREEARKLSAA
jgi:hypothetical protein